MTTSHFRHGFTDLPTVEKIRSMLLVRDECAALSDVQRRRFLDTGADLGNCYIGQVWVEPAPRDPAWNVQVAR